MRTERFTYLFKQYLHKRYTEQEKTEFFLLLKQPKYHSLLEQLSEQNAVPVNQASLVDEETATQILESILHFREEAAVLYSNPLQPARRISFLKTAWFRYAAAVILLLGCGAYLWKTNRKTDKTLAQRAEIPKTDVAPGSNKATLTLSDGSTIVLNSASNGVLAQQGGSEIIKTASGQVIYRPKENVQRQVLLNTLTTPRGGQYQLLLPDGTKVWLNAASSIKYPAQFVGALRNVKVTGEAYFEVARDEQKPFIVDVNEKSTVQVLGTSFNINSYPEEEGIKTTLLEGSVKVSNVSTNASRGSGNGAAKSFGIGHKLKSIVLKPDQQAIVTYGDQQPTVVNDVDLDQVIAWKNGYFNLQDANFTHVVQQLQRWYDIDVKYEGAVPEVQFKGKMNRAVKLSTVINWFSEIGINARLEGKTLVISN